MSMTQNRREFLTTVGATSIAAAGLPGEASAAAPFFKLYLMIPNNQPARMIWGTLAAQQMTKLGIDVISSFVPFTVIIPRRSTGEGKTHPEGGWDAYLERYYYNSIAPVPNNLFRSTALPPNGQNFYYVNDPQIDKALDDYAGARDEKSKMEAIRRFEKRWYDTEPMTILFYPQDVIAVNPKLKGYNATTFNPVFFPDPENWTIEGAGADGYARLSPPGRRRRTSSRCSPRATTNRTSSGRCTIGCTSTRTGKQEARAGARREPHHVGGRPPLGAQAAAGREMAQRRGVHRDRREVHLGHDPQQGLYQPVPIGVPGGLRLARRLQGHRPARDHGRLAALHDPVPRMGHGRMQIMPEHGYKDIKPEQIRGHAVNTWLGSYSVKTSDGKTYAARGRDRHRSVGRGRIRPGAEGLQVHRRTRTTGRRRPAT